MYAVILAGGGGTRLWPLSRARRPKPFLPLLDGGRCLLEATVARLSPLVAPEDVFVVTDARYAPLVRDAVPELPAENLIGEPFGRNTTAAIALAAHVVRRPTDEVMISLHADQAVDDEAGFREALAAAAVRAAAGDIATVGIEPTEPATGYGYVVATGSPDERAGRPTFRVERFEEKPSPARARELIEGGHAYWNAGSFVWRRDTLLDGLAAHAPDVDAPLAAWAARHPRPIAGADGDAWPGEALRDTYAALPARAIDYALLEPASLAGRVAVVPARVGWSDLGSWSALRQYRGQGGGAVISAEAPAQVLEIDSQGLLVHAAGGRTVALVGLRDIVVIDTPDALLVSSAAAAQDVRHVVERLKDEGREELL